MHPAITDCLVVGIPDERFGQCVAAVVASEEVGESFGEEVQAFCRRELAGYKCPRVISVQPAIQRGPNGKANYPWARELLLDQAAAH
jgi:fatty-acyl-CoA synthase